MGRYVAERILAAGLTLLLLSVVIFGVSRLAGDPLDLIMPAEASEEDRAAVRHSLGLDQPVITQYFIWARNMVVGDFGRSLRRPIPVRDLIADRLPTTLALASGAVALALLVGLGIGVAASVAHRGTVDRAALVIISLVQATPPFVSGIALILIVGVHLRALPVIAGGGFDSWVMPLTTLALVPLPGIARVTRSAMLGALQSDYVFFARARGVSETAVVLRHAVPNTLVPVVTYIGPLMGRLLAGSIVVETVFAVPGMGRLAYEAVIARDFPLIQGVVVVSIAVLLLLSILTDLLYTRLDPRIALR